MNIITKRNGIALIAVLSILLVLTLLLPLMFSMSERAMESAMTGTDEQRASYLARTMIEFTVGAFQDCYDAAEEDEAEGFEIPDDPADVTDELKQTELYKLDQFLKVSKKMTVSVMYMYRNTAVDYRVEAGTFEPQKPNESDADYRKRYLAFFHNEYQKLGIIYSTTVPSGYTEAQALNEEIPEGTISQVTYIDKEGQRKTATAEYMGYATCNVIYNDATDYFKTWYDVAQDKWITEKIEDDDAEIQYKNYLVEAKQALAGNNELNKTKPQIFRVQNKNVEFTSRAVINGRGATRRCILVLPTKPAESNWIVPASIESNQIFPDTSQCSGVTALSMKNGSMFIDGEAIQGQPVYGFSCIGNMVISTKKIKYKATDNDYLGLNKGDLMDYTDYVNAYNNKVDAHNNEVNAHNKAIDDWNAANPKNKRSDYRNDYHEQISSNLADFSLGLHPETTTLNPERDPTFSTLKSNNMRTWASSAQRDNFVAFTATAGIQFDMPVNIIMNPCRTGRIGDGIAKNKSLYKVLYLQAPTIVFNDTVNTFISLYTKTSLLALAFDYNAYRMSTIILAAPESTPYTMEVTDGTSGKLKTVKAGKVYFAEDAYVWLIPFTENGSNHKTQTVYHKGKDIILYKFANAGDVFLFNAEKETMINGESKKAGFSMTSYFMDVVYSKDTTDTSNVEWWQLWSGIQSLIFDSAVSGLRPKTYNKEDLQWVGNMNTGSQGSPNVDDFYVIWES
ncbi:MAG: hypothetical protein IIX14_05365 [Clostridia bacterium]|nr:hypothetical protein [Clostridia bacterium]